MVETKKSEAVKSVVGHIVATDKERTEAIDALVKACINKKYFVDAREVANLGASKEINGFLVKALVEGGNTSSVPKIVELGVSEKTIDFLARTALDQNWLAEFPELLEQLPEVIESMIKICIVNAKVDTIQKVVKLRKDWKLTTLTTKEVNSLVETCCNQGDAGEAIKAVSLGDRELTTEEIKLLAKAVER